MTDDLILIRDYNSNDYEEIKKLYFDTNTFGGDFDENRDSEDKLNLLLKCNPGSILIAEVAGKIVGTVTLFEDKRAAWLYRFAVKDNSSKISELLFKEGSKRLKERGHNQVLVYAPSNDKKFEERYSKLNFNKGEDYTCYWKNI